MDATEGLFNPSLTAALKKLDPEDSEQIVEYLKTQALLTREKALLQSSLRDQKKLLVENGKLKKDIEQLRAQLHERQRRRTVKALLSPPPPKSGPAPVAPVNQLSSPAAVTAAVLSKSPPPSSQDQRERQRRRKGGERKALPPADSLLLGAEPRLDVSRLDLRTGRILGARRHPLATTLTVQEVDVGEKVPRKVVSKLGGKIQLEELPGALAVLLCNVKASKQRGVVSQARILLCCTSDDDTELLLPPTSSNPGDRVTFLSYPGDPDKVLQSKQKIWETLQPDLQIDSRGVANYKGCRFEVKGKGLCRAPTLTNCTIR